ALVRPRQFGCCLDSSNPRQATLKCWVLTYRPNRKGSACEVAPCLSTPVSTNVSQPQIISRCIAESGHCLHANGALESTNCGSLWGLWTGARRPLAWAAEA